LKTTATATGKVVVVRHSGGMETIYGHLSKTLVSVNQAIKAGETVGLGGNSGRSTGSHCILRPFLRTGL